MKKMVFAEFGGPEVLHLVDARSPTPGPACSGSPCALRA